jgi:hypothetical protein
MANFEGNGMGTLVLSDQPQSLVGFCGFGKVNVFHVIGLLLV